MCRSTLETVATSIRETLKNKFPSPFSLCCVHLFYFVFFFFLSFYLPPLLSTLIKWKKSWKIDSSEGNRGMRARYKVVASSSSFSIIFQICANKFKRLEPQMEIVRVTEKRRRLVSIDNGDGHFHLDGAIAGERINDDANPLQLLIC